MKDADRNVAILERPEAGTKTVEKEVFPRTGEAKAGAKAEKPEASEEIMIEEINIDGMCGVY